MLTILAILGSMAWDKHKRPNIRWTTAEIYLQVAHHRLLRDASFGPEIRIIPERKSNA